MDVHEIDYPTAEALARRLHAGQVDKSGGPYIDHLLRVAARVTLLGGSEEARVVAVLHDAVEDGRTTFEALRGLGAGGAVLGALDALTRRPEEDYPAFIDRVCDRGGDAVLVKLADMADNADPVRLARLPADERRRLEDRYAVPLARLTATAAALEHPLGRIGLA